MDALRPLDRPETNRLKRNEQHSNPATKPMDIHMVQNTRAEYLPDGTEFREYSSSVPQGNEPARHAEGPNPNRVISYLIMRFSQKSF